MTVAASSLKPCALFHGFTDTGLLILAEIAHEKELAPGSVLFAQGAPAESLFLVERGLVELSVGDAAHAKRLCDLGPGTSLGEMALVRAGVRAVHARAKITTRVIEIRRGDFNDTLKDKPQACIKLMLNIFAAVEQRLNAAKPDLLSLI